MGKEKNEESSERRWRESSRDETYLQQRGRGGENKAEQTPSKHSSSQDPALSWTGTKKKESQPKKIATSSM